jgi:hypothetical protein
MMTTLPKGWDFQDIYYYRRSDRPAQFYYIPGSPVPQRSGQGMLAVSFMVLNELAMLQVSAQWLVEERILDALKTHLLQQFPELSAATIDLQLAPVTVEQVVLTLKNQAGHEDVLSSGLSSGQSPFSKVFSVQLSDDQRAQVIAVFKGRTEVLTVRYQGALLVETWATVAISGDVTNLLLQLPKAATTADCLPLIATAIAQKVLKLERSASAEARPELTHRTEEQAKAQAAELLLQMLKSAVKLPKSQFQVKASLKESVPIKFERCVDVNTWFPNGDGSEYMQLVGL